MYSISSLNAVSFLFFLCAVSSVEKRIGVEIWIAKSVGLFFEYLI